MCSLFDDAHAVLSKLGLPDGGISLAERIINFGDRLMLRPEGEPDTADLVGKINELCDRAGIVEGDPAGRVELLAKRCEVQATYLAELESDLKAERAQLAAATKPERQNVDRAALIRVIKMCAEELT